MISYPTVKRIGDLFIAAVALTLTSPFILLGALAVKLTSPGPAHYRAWRAGLGGKPFVMYKLRTMYVGTDLPDRRITAADDERVTRVGRLLRRTKIDELPQLWNVLRGDMSIVGPRPEDWNIVCTYFTPEQREILRVRPGIASPVDLHWYPDLTYHDPAPQGIPMQQWYLRRHLPVQLAEGIRYARNQTFLLDLQVIFQLATCVLVYSWLPPARRPLPQELLPRGET